MVLWDVIPCCLVYRYLMLPSSEPDSTASRPKIHCCKNLIYQDCSLRNFFLHLHPSLSKHSEQGEINRFLCHGIQQKANLYNSERAIPCSRLLSVLSSSKTQYSKQHTIITNKNNLSKLMGTINKINAIITHECNTYITQ